MKTIFESAHLDVYYDGHEVITNGYLSSSEKKCTELLDSLLNDDCLTYICNHIPETYDVTLRKQTVPEKYAVLGHILTLKRAMDDYPTLYTNAYKNEIISKILIKCYDLYYKHVENISTVKEYYRTKTLIRNLCELGFIHYKIFKQTKKQTLDPLELLPKRTSSCNGCFMDLLVIELSCKCQFCEMCWNKIGRKCPRCTKMIKEKLNN